MRRGCHVNAVFTVGKKLRSILLHHWIKRYPDLLSTRIRIHVADSKLSTLESGFKTVRISTGCVWTDWPSRKENVADSKVSGYEWTGPIKSGVIWSFFAYDAWAGETASSCSALSKSIEHQPFLLRLYLISPIFVSQRRTKSKASSCAHLFHFSSLESNYMYN